MVQERVFRQTTPDYQAGEEGYPKKKRVRINEGSRQLAAARRADPHRKRRTPHELMI
jgi:hypothetical protein